MKQLFVIVAGTRPEIVKLAPVVQEIRSRRLDFTFITSGQHYDYDLSQRFLEELVLPRPDHSIRLSKRDPAAQMGEMMICLGKSLPGDRNVTVVVEGDTNTVAAAALVARKRALRVAHVEAGLRSFDWRMPEEHNRIVVDHVADILFAPTKTAQANLSKERVYGEVYVTGNTVIDAVIRHVSIALRKSRIQKEINFRNYVLATAHRAENVDDPRVLKSLVDVMVESPLPVVFPVHPRTESALRRFGLKARLEKCENVQLLPPLGYLDFLVLLKNCEIILTDSGGLQEEATAPPIRKPVLVFRISTERPEAVKAGFALVVGVRKKPVLKALNGYASKGFKIPRANSPFGDGKASARIVDILENTA